MSLKPGDRVKIIVGGPHEHFGRIATVARPYNSTIRDVVVYFGDQDEDEYIYSPDELEKVPEKVPTLMGAGLFDMRWLSTKTLSQLHDSISVGPKAETELFSMVRRILIERGELS